VNEPVSIDVIVGDTVLLGVGDDVGLGEDVSVSVGVRDGVGFADTVGLGVDEDVGLGDSVSVSVGVSDDVGVAVDVGAGVPLTVRVPVTVAFAVGDDVGVGVMLGTGAVGEIEGVSLRLDVGLGVKEGVGLAVLVFDGLTLGVFVKDGVTLGVQLGVRVTVRVRVPETEGVALGESDDERVASSGVALKGYAGTSHCDSVILAAYSRSLRGALPQHVTEKLKSTPHHVPLRLPTMNPNCPLGCSIAPCETPPQHVRFQSAPIPQPRASPSVAMRRSAGFATVLHAAPPTLQQLTVPSASRE
jgi:hypothetical protein